MIENLKLIIECTEIILYERIYFPYNTDPQFLAGIWYAYGSTRKNKQPISSFIDLSEHKFPEISSNDEQLCCRWFNSGVAGEINNNEDFICGMHAALQIF